MKTRYAATAALCCCVVLSACSQDAATPPPTAASAVHTKGPAAPPRKGPTPEELTAGMAAAPTVGKNLSIVDVKFELAQRPQIGQVLEINLALIPKFDGGPATLQISSSPGLDAAQGDTPYEVPVVTAGEVYRHTLHMTPSSEGVLLATLTVSLKHDDLTDSEVFSVPVIVDR